MAGVKITGSPLLRVTDLRVWFPAEKKFFGKPEKFIKAVDGVSFDIFENETLGVVGESGCGKTTLGRTLLCLQSATNGSILHRGKDLLTMGKKELQALRKDIQVVFQDPYASLNPRLTIGEAIREAMEVHEVLDSGRARKERVVELLEKVNLKADHFNRYPHAFSGGQRQRIGIARALALNPGFIVFDESVSALDVSVQAQVLNLVNDLKAEFGFTAMFISHDLGVVRYISDRILVMNKGVIEEIGQAETVFSQPASAYTRKLLEAIPGNKRQSG
jgi:peptide/nickel transport system ATP-binding protein